MVGGRAKSGGHQVQTCEPSAGLRRYDSLFEILPGPPDHHDAELTKGVLSGLLPLHRLKWCLTRLEMLAILDVPVEPDHEEPCPVEVGPGHVFSVFVVELVLQARDR